MEGYEKIMSKLQELQNQLQELQNRVLKLTKLIGQPVKEKLKTKEACKYLGVSENTLRARCIEKQVYPNKSGGLNYYKVSDLDRILNGGAAH